MHTSISLPHLPPPHAPPGLAARSRIRAGNAGSLALSISSRPVTPALRLGESRSLAQLPTPMMRRYSRGGSRIAAASVYGFSWPGMEGRLAQTSDEWFGTKSKLLEETRRL